MATRVIPTGEGDVTLSGTLAWNIRVCMRSDQKGQEDEPPLPSTAWLAWHLLKPPAGTPRRHLPALLRPARENLTLGLARGQA